MKQLFDIVGINQRNLEFIHGRNLRRFFPHIDNKVLTKSLLAKHNIGTPKTICVVEYFGDIPSTIQSVMDCKSFVVKPARGSGGGGILVISGVSEKGWQTPDGRVINKDMLQHHLSKILFGVYSAGTCDSDLVLIEEYLSIHPLLDDFYPRGVSDVRVLLIDGSIVMAMLRTPTDASKGRANLHQGGIGVPIDLQSGKLGSALYGSERVSYHPDTGRRIQGITLPYWNDILRIAVEAAQAAELNFIGVDIVIDCNQGPVVLEMNARPGLQIQAVNQLGITKALRQVKVRN